MTHLLPCLKHFILSVAIACPTLASAASVVYLDSKGLCHLKLSGFELKDVRVYAKVQDMRSALRDVKLLDAHSCAAALLGTDNEIDFILENNLKALPRAHQYSQLSEGRVIIVVSSGVEFVNLYRHVRRVGVLPGGSPPGPPGGRTGRNEHSNRRTGAPEEACKFDGELCVSSSSEVSFQAGCGDVSFTVTSTGSLKFTTSGDAGGLTINAN